jgi:SAM-dependent methyltransferase
VVVSAAHGDRRDERHAVAARTSRPDAVVWHELECGSYTADLALWRELAARAGTGTGAQPVLDVGAGSGRVSLDLAARGHRVTALDRDAELLRALRERPGAGAIETVCADARALDLPRRDFSVCLVPMQTIQLFGPADDRLAFLRGARAHLRRGGLLACAIVTDVESFDCACGDVAPEPDSALVDGIRYLSRPTRVLVSAQTVRIERERTAFHPAHSDTPLLREHDVVQLARLTATQLLREGAAAGLTPAGTLEIPATEEHVASEVVLLHA